MRWLPEHSKGFSLLELMITICIASVIMLGIFAIYTSQTKMQRNEMISLDMMQNLRAGFYQMDRDIRVAGFDPRHTAGGGITRANLSDIQFTIDDNMDGDVNDANERIRYFLSDDATGNGLSDVAGATLQRQVLAAASQVLSNDIEALMFFYFNSAGVRLNDDGNGNVVANIANIATVQVAMIARGSGIMGGYRNTTTYSITFPNGTVQNIYTAPGDSVKRELLTTVIRCRNLNMNQ